MLSPIYRVIEYRYYKLCRMVLFPMTMSDLRLQHCSTLNNLKIAILQWQTNKNSYMIYQMVSL